MNEFLEIKCPLLLAFFPSFLLVVGVLLIVKIHWIINQLQKLLRVDGLVWICGVKLLRLNEDRTFPLNDFFNLIVLNTEKRIELKFNQIHIFYHHQQPHHHPPNTQPAFNFHSSSLSLLTNNNQSSIHHIEGCALRIFFLLFLIFHKTFKHNFPSFQTSFLHHQLSHAFFMIN